MNALWRTSTCLLAATLIAAALSWQRPAFSAEDDVFNNSQPIEIKFGTDSKAPRISATFGTLAAMTLLAVLPALLVMTTAFTRIIIVLSFLRHALATQQTPPNLVLIGLAMFLTLFIMSPVFQKMHKDAVGPLLKGEIEATEAWDKGVKPLRDFMGQQTRKKDLSLMIEMSRAEAPETFDDVPTLTLIPAFLLSELRTAFQMGFLLFLPFLIIDLVVSAVLMSMGMVMMPPAMVSLPLKLLLFVMADGWTLLVKSLVASFAAAG